MRPLVVFDLDGTLIDSRRDLADSTNEMLESYGAGPLAVDAVTAMVGEGVRVLVERALRAAGCDPAEPAAVDRFRAIYDTRLLNHTRPYVGIPEALADAAARADLAVLTNKPEKPTRRILDAFALTPRFAYILGGDSGFPRKPDPAGLTHVISELGGAPARTLMVGDTPVDEETARRAGAAFCAAGYGFAGLEPTGRTARVPADLPAVIGAFVKGVQSGLSPGGNS